MFRPLDICTSYHNLFFLGAGYPLFFQFIFFALGIQIIIFVVSGIFNIITNLQIDGCNQAEPLYVFGKECVSTWWTRMSLVSKTSFLFIDIYFIII